MSGSEIALLSVGYGLGMVFTWARVATLWAWYVRRNSRYFRYSHFDPRSSKPAAEHWFGGGVIGMLVAPFWPVAILVFALRRHLLAPPEDVRLAKAEIEAERAEAEAQRQRERIKELERELDLVP